jgi:hypothetical protein
MNSPFWEVVGYVGASAFVLAVVLSLIGRRLFSSSEQRTAKLGKEIIGTIGGARSAREASAELEKRRAH